MKHKRGQLTLEALSAFLLLLILLSILGASVSHTSSEVLRAQQFSAERQSLSEQSLGVIIFATHSLSALELPPSWVPNATMGNGQIRYTTSSNTSAAIPFDSNLRKVPA